ncbi:uncharacterized protein LOC120328803 isoform X1 [Styela clava]
MAIQWHITYSKNATPTDLYFEFKDPKKLSVETQDENTTTVMFMDDTGEQTLTLTFMVDEAGDFYKLSSAQLSFCVNNMAFPDADNMNKTIVASANLNLMETSVEMSYMCSTETQFRLTSNDTTNDTSIYVRFTSPSKKSLQLQAIRFKKKSEYGSSAKCLTDMPPTAINMSYKVLSDKEKNICARIDSIINLLNIQYMAIDGSSMVANVPLTADATATGSCEKNLTTVMIDLGSKHGVSTGNLTLYYVLKSVTYAYYADDVLEAVLDNITYVYDPMSPYFPNHGSMNANETITAAGLNAFQIPATMSYECSASTGVNVTEKMMVNFTDTKMQAFNLQGGNYSTASNCQATPTTAIPVTTQPIIPDPSLPTSSERRIKDGNDTCLHAVIGLQMRVFYQEKDKPDGNLTEIFFNFDADNCTQSAVCTNSSNAVITFDRTADYEQQLALTFTKDDKSKMTYLSQVDLEYTINKYFPNAKDTSGKKKTYTNTQMFLSASDTKSYQCNSTWTDVLMSNDDNVVVRIVPLKVEPFATSDKFRPGQKCFSDLPVPKPNTGKWYVNSTGKNDSVCAAFEFSSSVNITYGLLVDPNPKTVTIPLDSVKHNVTESFGVCMPNTTVLMIPMDNGMMNFTFEFSKKNISKDGKSFKFVMTTATISYSTNTKYLPNHEYVDGGVVMLTNNTLELFSSDQAHSYKCTTNVTTGVQMKAWLSFSDVQIQPFGVSSTDGQFSAADDCSADDKLSKAARIGILCAIVIAGISLLTCVCCFAYRKYKLKQSGYKAFR